MTDAVVETPQGFDLRIIVENHNPFPIHLKKGVILGSLEQVDLASREVERPGTSIEHDNASSRETQEDPLLLLLPYPQMLIDLRS